MAVAGQLGLLRGSGKRIWQLLAGWLRRFALVERGKGVHGPIWRQQHGRQKQKLSVATGNRCVHHRDVEHQWVWVLVLQGRDDQSGFPLVHAARGIRPDDRCDPVVLKKLPDDLACRIGVAAVAGELYLGALNRPVATTGQRRVPGGLKGHS